MVIPQHEMDVLKLICAGLTTKAIADKLNRKMKTVVKQRQWLYARLGVGNVIALIRVALRKNLITVEEFTSYDGCENITHCLIEN